MALQGPVKVAKKLKIVVSEPIVLLKLKNYTKWFGCLCQKFENALRVVEAGAKLESPPRGAQTVQQLLKFGQNNPKWPKRVHDLGNRCILLLYNAKTIQAGKMEVISIERPFFID